MSNIECKSCGAPDQGNLAVCPNCGRKFARNPKLAHVPATDNEIECETHGIRASVRRILVKIGDIVEELSIADFISNVVRNIKSFILSLPGVIFLFFLVMISLSVIGALNNNTRLLSFAGLAWMYVWIMIFVISALTHSGLEKFKTDVNKSLLLRHDSPFILLLKGLRWIVALAGKWAYTIAGISISLAHGFTSLHIWIARGELYEMFDPERFSYFSAIFLIGAPVYGFFADMLNRLRESKKYGEGVYLIGGIEFLRGFLLLITGLIGGRSALAASYSIFRHPIQWFSHDWFSVTYPESTAYALYEGLGTFFFVLIYLLVPAGLAFSSRGDINNNKRGESTETPLPILYSLFYVSLFFLLISGYVAWHEGWIAMAGKFILGLIFLLIIGIANLVEFIFGLFS